EVVALEVDLQEEASEEVLEEASVAEWAVVVAPVEVGKAIVFNIFLQDSKHSVSLRPVFNHNSKLKKTKTQKNKNSKKQKHKKTKEQKHKKIESVKKQKQRWWSTERNKRHMEVLD